MNPRTPARPTLRRLQAALACALPLGLLCLTMPASAAVMISQVYGGGGNSGALYKYDYVELHNSGAAAVNLAGWSLQYASAAGTSWNASMALTGSIPAGGYFLLRLASQSTSVGAELPVMPDVTVASPPNISGSNGKLALVNTAAALVGTCPTGGPIVDFVGYGGTASCAETAPAPSPTGNSSALLRATVGSSCQDTNNNAADFANATPTPRNSSTPAQACNAGGGPGPDPEPPVAATIPAIQGSGATSPLAGKTVLTRGAVTKVTNNGFFIQDTTGDGNPATSDGIFVFTDATVFAAAAVGNLVDVTGTVVEFSLGAGTAATPLTELSGVTAVVLQGSGQSVAPVAITLPLAAVTDFERHEGMLVRIDTPTIVQQNFVQARFGQLTLGVGRHETPTNRHRPGTAEAVALDALQARSRFLLDDGSSLQNPNPTPYLGANGLPRAGDAVGSITGVLDFGPAGSNSAGPGLYRIQPTAAPTITAANPRPPALAAVGGNVRAGAMNVLNFFTTFTDGDTAAPGLQTGQGCTLGGSTAPGNCRGANNATEFERQRLKIVNTLAGLNADAVGLIEIQNNGSTALDNLLAALNAKVGAGTYAAVPDPSGFPGTGTDAIKLAIVYKPAKLQPVLGSISDTNPVHNRPPLAQAFAGANGERFTLVVNHFKSKGSCPAPGDADAPGNTDAGDGQGCWNLQRLQQAQALRTFVSQLQGTRGTSNVLLVGDFNAYAKEDPIIDLTSNGYVDQIGRFNSFGYSYVFDGLAGRLDSAIATPTLSAKVVNATEWHINADESIAKDYNLEFRAPQLCSGVPCPADEFNGSTPYRASDHDPVLIGLSLFKPVTGTAARDVLAGSAGDDLFNGGAGADQLTGGAGTNIYAYASMRDAGDTITDFVPGKDLLDLRALLQSIAASPATAVTAGVIRFAASGSSTLVLIDTDGSAGPQAARTLATLLNVSPGQIVPARDLILQ